MKIGIIGGGQLALMMIQSHPEHEYTVIDPAPQAPASKFANFLKAKYDDSTALGFLARNCEVITYEFENVPSQKLHIFGDKIKPNWKILEISQNRFAEKQYAQSLGLKTPNFFLINKVGQLRKILEQYPNKKWVLKTTSGGYDGKGQVTIFGTNITAVVTQFLRDQDCILEEFIDFDYETSIVATRNAQGDFVNLLPTKNHHVNGILKQTHNLENIDFVDEMVNGAKRVMEGADVIGTLAIEFFITKGGPIFNEMAPRPHNSGHWSIEGTTASQFFNHINAITNAPLVVPQNKGFTAMINLLGHEYTLAKQNIQFNEHIALHDYFKTDEKIGRKMGHVTINFDNINDVQIAIKKVQEGIK